MFNEANQETQVLKFFYNGIKDNGGKLQRVFYSDSQLINHPAGTLTIYARDYTNMSAGVHAAFVVKNDSEYQSDYIVQDVIRVEPSHPLYQQVLAALIEKKAKDSIKQAKRMQKFEQRQTA